MMTKYILTDIEGKDDMEVETEGNTVVGVVDLTGSSKRPSLPTPEQLQGALELYMRSGDATIETALSTFKSSYSTIRKIDE